MKTIYATFSTIEPIRVTDEQYKRILNENKEGSWLPPYFTFEIIKTSTNFDLSNLDRIETEDCRILWKA